MTGSENRVWKICAVVLSLRSIIARKKPSHWVLLFLSSFVMLTAFTAANLLSRMYYVNGGQSRWLLAWIAAAGWPLTAAFLVPMYFKNGISPTPLTWQLTLSYAVIGLLIFVTNLSYAWAYAYLPASTASLVSSSVLAFTAIFACFIVNKRLNISTLNAVVIITSASVIIGLDSDSDRPAGVSHGQYIAGFLWGILASALEGLIYALLELLFIKFLGRRSFHVVLEQELMVSLFACIFATIGAVVNNDFPAMRSEARTFKHGAWSYYMVVFCGAVAFQLGILASVAVLFLASTLMAGVLNAAKLPIASIAAVIFFHDPMSGFKILSLLLTLWGCASYIYGSTLEVKPKQDADERREVDVAIIN